MTEPPVTHPPEAKTPLRLEDLPAPPALPLLLRLYTDPRLRQLVPLELSLRFARLRAELFWRRSPGGRAEMIDDMRFLLECSELADQVPEIAKRHAVEVSVLAEFNWQPSSLGSRIPLQGLEHLRDAQARGRGVLLHFMHFGPFTRLANVLRLHGIDTWAVTSDVWLQGYPPGLFGHKAYSFLRAGVTNSSVITAPGSFPFLKQLLGRGELVCISSDVPGSLPAEFLGRRIRISSGTARLALDSGAQIVCVTWHRKGRPRLPLMRLNPAIDPRRYEDPVSLQAAILEAHTPAVLEWPEALEQPRRRWTLAEDDTV